MIITRISPLSGEHSRDLPVTQEQLDSIGKKLIQDIFPDLSASDREFILTGYTDEDWNKMFPPEEE
jgi:hypothetical protein